MSSDAIGELTALRQTGWRAGWSPLMKAGFGAWWRTKEWWIQALLWSGIINGSLAIAIWGEPDDDLDVVELYGVMTMFAAIAVAILMQEAIVGEKRSGTAAWVLSKPASRAAFMASKLVPNAVGVVATMIAIPTAFVMVQMSLAGLEFSAPRFALGAAVAALNLLFYLTLTLMLGTLFDTAGPVIAIPLAFAFGQQLLAGIPGLSSVLPWALVVSAGGSESSDVAAIITGQPLPAPAAIPIVALACVLFTVVAFAQWHRTEL